MSSVGIILKRLLINLGESGILHGKWGKLSQILQRSDLDESENQEKSTHRTNVGKQKMENLE